MNSLRILLVDGGSDKSDAISTNLSSANHIVVVTSGLDEAKEAVLVEQFDAVLLLARFPTASVGDFVSKLRRTEAQRNTTKIPVLILESLFVTGDEGVFDGCVNEPLDPLALTQSVKSLGAALGKPMELKASSEIDRLPVLEVDKFDEQVGGDSELMVEIIDLFLEEQKGQVKGMEDCLAHNDWDSLSKIAHTIKGSLGSLHAARARGRAQELETAARNGEVEVSKTAHRQLIRDLETLEPELLDLRDSVTSAT